MSFMIEDATVKAETDKAILVIADSLDEEVWIPQSQIDEDSEVWRKG